MSPSVSTRLRPIPELKPLDWEQILAVEIRECGEPLVPASLYPERILARSVYFAERYEGAYPEVYLRSGVYERLLAAADSLPPGYRLVLFDGWRSGSLQQELFEDYVRALGERYPERTEEELRSLASVYVARPSEDPARPSPHSTGAAVDLSIADWKGRLLQMGGGFDEKSNRSNTCHYETCCPAAALDAAARKALENRRLLYHAMTGAGFTNYAEEWWHYDFGNQNWVYFSGRTEPARYGPASPPS